MTWSKSLRFRDCRRRFGNQAVPLAPIGQLEVVLGPIAVNASEEDPIRLGGVSAAAIDVAGPKTDLPPLHSDEKTVTLPGDPSLERFPVVQQNDPLFRLRPRWSRSGLGDRNVCRKEQGRRDGALR